MVLASTQAGGGWNHTERVLARNGGSLRPPFRHRKGHIMNNPSSKNTIYNVSIKLILDNIKVDESTGCWEWCGVKSTSRYGRKYHNGRQWAAHRLSYSLFIGDIKDGEFVCHTCDNPGCCNPEHLWAGTHQENMADRNDKGRLAHGESHGNSKLTLRDVASIRAAYAASDHTATELSVIYEVHDAAICRIITGESWARAGGPKSDVASSGQSRNIGVRNGNSKLTEKDVLEIVSLIDSGGATRLELSKMFGVGVAAISRINKGIVWSHITKRVG